MSTCTGDYAAAKQTYDQAFNCCTASAWNPRPSSAWPCLTAVLRQTGDWERAVTLCRQVIASSDATLHAGPWPPASSARSSPTAARPGRPPLLLESLTLARRIELGDSRGLAAAGLLTALAQVAADAGQDEAMSALSHALGETALLDGSAEQAASQFAQALVLLQGLDVPFDRSRDRTPGRRPGGWHQPGARRPWSTWSPLPHGPPAGRPAPGGTAHRQPHPPWAGGPTAASAEKRRSPRRPTAA